MKKKKVLLFIIMIMATNLFTQNFDLNGGYRFTVYSGLAGINLKDSELIYVPLDDDKQNLSVPCSIIHIDGLTFLKMSEVIPKEFTEDYIYRNKKDIVTDDKFLISLIESGVDFINISYHMDDEFISYERLKHIRSIYYISYFRCILIIKIEFMEINIYFVISII